MAHGYGEVIIVRVRKSGYDILKNYASKRNITMSDLVRRVLSSFAAQVILGPKK